MQSAFIATCPNSNEAVIVVLGVTTVSEFRAAAAAQGLIRTCDDEEGYEFYKPLQAWAVLTPEGTWDLGASSDAPDALPAMVATARWVSITSCQCEACPVNEGTHKPAGALLQIDEPKSSVNQVDEAINSLLRAALIEGGCSAERVIEAREETNLRRAELRTLLSTPQPCSRSHPHEEMTPMCELRREIARLTNALARAEAAQQARIAELEAQLDSIGAGGVEPLRKPAAAQQAVQADAPLPLLLRDIARDLGITVPQACIALKPLGNYSTNSAVTAEMARMLRDHFPATAHPAEGVPARAGMYAEARECEHCNHVGINDSAEGIATCVACQWIGDSPKEDKCPDCEAEGTMTASCPKCHHEYRLIADATLAADHPTQQGMDAPIIQALAAGISIQQWQSSIDILIGSSDLLVRAIASGKETRIELIRRAVSEALAAQAKQGEQ